MVIDLLLFYLIHFENLSLEAKNFHIKFYSNFASSCCQKNIQTHDRHNHSHYILHMCMLMQVYDTCKICS